MVVELNKFFTINYENILLITRIRTLENKIIKRIESLINWSIKEGKYINICLSNKEESLIITNPLKIILNNIEVLKILEINKKYKFIELEERKTYINGKISFISEKYNNTKKRKEEYLINISSNNRNNRNKIITKENISIILN